MEFLHASLDILDYTLDSDRKRHIAGGILLSIAILFGGFALTVMTIKTEDNYEQQD